MTEKNKQSDPQTHDFQCLHEIVHAARNALSSDYWDYLVGGTETETTVKRNRLALDRLAFRPRVLCDVRETHTARDFLGHRLTMPVLLAPIGSLQSFHPDGGAAAAQAAAAFGTMNIQSSVSAPDLEGTARAADNPKIYQLYVRGDKGWVDDIVHRAVAAGYAGFCLTVDTAHYSRRERDIAKRFVKPWRRGNTGMDYQQALNWDDVAHFKKNHRIPLLLKGIATVEDAAIAVDHGVDVVYVSNHGGRQLDHGLGAMDVLPEIVDTVSGAAKIMVDGGICRGSDIAKALALGADCIAVGRMLGYGLAADGARGAVRMLELLHEELCIALGLLGVDDIAKLTRSHLRTAEPVTLPHVTSAFPLLAVRDRQY